MNQTRSWQPSCTIKTLKQRASAYTKIRRFFEQRHVTEVETPVLATSAVSDPQIDSIQARQEQPRWLRTSPEYFHKRLLAAGSGDIYELGKVFRDGEAGRWHNPEFTLLEWYRVGWHYSQLMHEVENLLRHLLAGDPNQPGPAKTLTYQELHLDFLGFNPVTASDQKLRQYAANAGLYEPPTDRALLQDFIYGVAVREHLTDNTLTFVHEFPVEQAALARIRPGQPSVAERFELFMGKVEIANGYQELNDGAEQRRRFEQDQQRRAMLGKPRNPIDQHLLNALDAGMPECSGVALGVDRLLAALSNSPQLSEQLSFSWTNS